MNSEFLDLINLKDFEENLSGLASDLKTGSSFISIHEAVDKFLASNIYAPESLPPFTRSAVDGYAVRARDTFGASEIQPALFEIIGEVSMGEKAKISPGRGEAVYIATGAMLPVDADSCIMIEETDKIAEDRIEVFTDVSPGENIIKKGDDIKEDELLLKTGHRLRAQDIGALAGLGITEVEVFDPPEISLISTGDEIVPPGNKKKNGEIRDINTPALAALFEKWGAQAKSYGIVPDRKKDLKKSIRDCLSSDLIVVSGGSSVGHRDFTLDAINETGSPGVIQHGLAVKPGKPTVVGKIDDTLVLGLPGNPASAWVVSCLIVPFVLKTMFGRKTSALETRFQVARGKLKNQMASARGRSEYIPVKFLSPHENNLIKPIFGKSNLITTLVEADGFINIEAEKEGLEAGTGVEVYSVDRDLGLYSEERVVKNER